MTNWFTEDEAMEVAPSKTVENETQPESSPEKKQDEVTPASEGESPAKATINNDEEPLPFHKHPRFKALTNENSELKKEIESIKASMSNFESKFSSQETKEQPIPAWFIRAFGDDQELYNEYKITEEAKLQEMQKAIESRFTSQLAPKIEQIEKEEESKKINNFIATELEAVKEEFPGIDTNMVMKVVYEKKLFDENGNLNFKAAAEWVNNNPKQSSNKTEVKKEIASKMTTNNSSEPVKSTFMTSEGIRKTGDWRNYFKNL